MPLNDGSPRIEGATDGTEIGNVGDRLKTDSADLLNSSGVEGNITVGTSAVAARVGGANLTSRKLLTIHNNAFLTTIYWGYTSGVTTSTGTPLAPGQFLALSAGPSTTVFLIAGSAGNNVRVTEAA